MPSLKIIKLLEQYNVRYVTDGPNTAKGNINVHCPWCGDGDPSEHLGIRVDNSGQYQGVYGCWRSAGHRGKNPIRLIAKLLGITYQRASELVSTSAPNLSDFDKSIAKLIGKDGENLATKTVQKLDFPKGFNALVINYFTVGHIKYLKRRGFPKKDLPKLIKRYEIMYTLMGPYKNRIIFPVRMNKKLVGWQGRDVTGSADIRYKALSHKTIRDDEPLAPMNIKDTIYNYDNLTGGKTLYIVEGPFDCLKIDFYGYKTGCHATALFSNAATAEQLYLLNQVVQLYSQVFVLLDEKELAQSMRLVQKIQHPKVKRATLGFDVEDPGDLSRKQVEIFLAEDTKMA